MLRVLLGWPAVALVFLVAPTSAQEYVVQATPRPVATDFEFYQIYDVRFAGSDILAVDWSTQSVVRVSEQGDVLGVAGGRGAGPGEFRGLRTAMACGGDIIAWDAVGGRLTYFDGALDLLDTRTLPAVREKRASRVECSGGDLLVSYSRAAPVSSIGPFRPNEDLYRLLPRDGTDSLEYLLTLPGNERYRQPGSAGPRLYGKRSLLRGLPEGLLIGGAEAFQIFRVELGQGVDTVAVMRAPSELRPLTSEELDAYWERQVTAVEQAGGADLRALRESFESYEFPEYLPPYTRVVADGERVLVRRFQGLLVEAESWEVFELESGRHLGSLRMPSDFSLFDIQGDTGVGVLRDEFDVERLAVLKLPSLE